MSKSATATVTAVAAEPELTFNKTTTSKPANGEKYALGETITYEITVTNTGNVTIKDITVTDELTGDEWTVASLAPGATSEKFTAQYEVTEADILKGEVVNVATGTGTGPDPDDPDVPVVPGVDPEPTEDPKPHMTFNKTTTSKPANGEKYALGETITYEITVTNTGNVTIKDITVTDELTGDEWTVASLAPGATSEKFTAQYEVTEADILKGEVVNVATGTGTGPDPDDPDVPVVPGVDPEPTEDPKPEIKVTKEADAKEYVYGDKITYTITVENTGNLTITSISVDDELTDDEWTIESLAPGAKQTFTTEYVVTLEDVTNESKTVKNVVEVKGASPDGTDVDKSAEVEVKVDLREITITAASQTRAYNGTALTNGGSSITSGKLAEGDTVAATVAGSQTEVGSSANRVTAYAISNTHTEIGEDGKEVQVVTDVTKGYKVTLVNGTLTVTTVPYTINYVFTWPGGAAPAGAPNPPAAATVNRGANYTVSTATYADIPYGIAPNGNVITVLRFQGWDTTGTINNVRSNRTITGAWTIQMVWYTVTYTDGVPGEVVFPDQVTTTLRIGANTPAFAGTPTREGFNFTGWAPAVSPTVTGNNVYTAQWAPIEEEEERIVEPTPEPTPVVEEEIVDEEVPQAAPAAAWALINLLAALGTVATAVGMIITFFKKKDDDDDGTKANPDEESDENKGKKSKFLGLIPAVASVIIFILTENMHNPMTLVDKWTIPMVLILAANGIVAYLTRNKKPEDEDTEKAAG